jgi:oxygen-independent coproporphyrinogen-3 oxidase
MCELAADPRSIAGRFGVTDPLVAEIESLGALAAQGIVSIRGGRVVVTEMGRPFVRLVAAAFDSYRGGSAKRHSVAV